MREFGASVDVGKMSLRGEDATAVLAEVSGMDGSDAAAAGNPTASLVVPSPCIWPPSAAVVPVAICVGGAGGGDGSGGILVSEEFVVGNVTGKNGANIDAEERGGTKERYSMKMNDYGGSNMMMMIV